VATSNAGKEAIICPFSGKMCRQCGIYRGRHYMLCAVHNEQAKETRSAKTRAWTIPSSPKWEMPNVDDCGNIMANVENLVEKRDV
jgi:hypothetical protein